MQISQITPVVGEVLTTASQIEKLSVIGVIALWAGLATYAAYKYQKRLALVFRQRDKARAYQIVYKAALDGAGIKVDTTHIDQQYRDDAADDATL